MVTLPEHQGDQTRYFTTSIDLRITGAFSSVGNLTISPDDVIAITQPKQGTVLSYNHAGKLLGRTSIKIPQLPPIRVSGVHAPFTFRTFGPNGRLIVTGIPVADASPSKNPPGTSRTGLAYISVGAKGDSARLIALMPRSGFCATEAGPGGTSKQWCIETLSDVSPDGRGVLLLLPGRDSYRLESIGIDGDTLFSRRFEYSRGSSVASGDSFKLGRSPFKITLPRTAEVHPQVMALLAGRDGTAWLHVQASASQDDWVILNSDGVILGRVVLPNVLRVLAAERGRVWALMRDGSIVRYRLE